MPQWSAKCNFVSAFLLTMASSLEARRVYYSHWGRSKCGSLRGRMLNHSSYFDGFAIPPVAPPLPPPPFFVCMPFPFVRFVCPTLMTACCVAAGDSVILAVGPLQLFAYPRKWEKEGNANACVSTCAHTC